MGDILLSKAYNQGEFIIYDDRPDFPVIECDQVHGAKIMEYQGSKLEDKEIDGIIISPKFHPGKSIAIKTADCLPILLIGEKVALIHAGWKGLATGILSHPKLKEIRPHYAFIGPSIQDYEVGDDFLKNFPKSAHFTKLEGHLKFNLQAEAYDQLIVNFKSIEVETSSICTLKSLNYNSYRRDKTTKRNWNIFKLNN